MASSKKATAAADVDLVTFEGDTVERVADTLSLPYPEISDEVWGWHAGVNRGR